MYNTLWGGLRGTTQVSKVRSILTEKRGMVDRITEDRGQNVELLFVVQGGF